MFLLVHNFYASKFATLSCVSVVFRPNVLIFHNLDTVGDQLSVDNDLCKIEQLHFNMRKNGLFHFAVVPFCDKNFYPKHECSQSSGPGLAESLQTLKKAVALLK